ncbi:MAG: phosphatidate cytidylyltransferase [Erysipelotrichaceae bacterium]|nr:phosphatidate cytidylyltransferase [Erysipelotrichaceae bacterium]
MKQRIITGIILAVVILPCVVYGALPFKIVIAFISIGAAYELLHITHNPKPLPYLYPVLAIYIVAQVFYGKELSGNNAIIIGLLIVLLTAALFDETMRMQRMAYYFTSSVLVSLGIHMIYVLRLQYGLNYVIFLAAATLLADTGAYFVGVKFGRHKLIERLSPKKTIEGSIGGIIVGGLGAILLTGYLPIELSTIGTVVSAFVLSTTGQIGDLTFSSFKRAFDIKDYSQIFPGHGGVLDRFDSIIFNAMVFGLLMKIFM